MDLTPTAEHEEFRYTVRAWLRENAPRELPSGDTREGFALHRQWERELFDAGWAVITWPREYGGQERDLWHWLIFEEEYYRAGLPQRVAQNGIFLLGPSLLQFGTQEQKRRILRRMAAVDDMWCQGWSEPEAGSDLASVSTRAVRDEQAGGWRLYGQKCWTTRGAFSSHLFGIFRTAPEAARHKGLTYLLVELNQPEVTVGEVCKLDGDEGFADVFFDGAFVSDANVLGDVGEGWKVAMATTGSERSLSLRSPGRFLATAGRLVDELRSSPEYLRGDDRLRAAVTDGWMAAHAYKLATDMIVSRLVAGEKLGAEASLSKLFWSEMDITLHETALSLQGENSDVDDEWMRGFEFALAGPIYAGTNEIQRNIVAERLLNLPRR